MNSSIPLLIIAATLTFGCSTPPTPAPLSPLRSVDVVGSGSISSHSFDVPTDNVSLVAPHRLETDATMRSDCRLLRLDRDLARDLFGVEPSPIAGYVVRTADLDARMPSVLPAPIRGVSNHAISLFSGEAGHVVEATETSFVQQFHVEATDGAMVLDPVLGTAQSGIVVKLEPKFSASAGPWSLNVSVESAQLADPIAELELSTFSGVPIFVQAPYFSRLVVKTESDLRQGESLILAACNIDDADEIVLIVITPSDGVTKMASAPTMNDPQTDRA